MHPGFPSVGRHFCEHASKQHKQHKQHNNNNTTTTQQQHNNTTQNNNNRVPQRLVEHNIVFQLRLPSRTLTFQFLEVAGTVSLFLALQAHPQYRVMCVETGFFRTFPRLKSATLPPRSGSALPPHSSPWTPAAYDVPMVLEEEEEESEEELVEFVEYVQHDGCWWGCEWVPARQRYCWWLAAADGPRLAIRSGGLCGSSAVDQGDLEPSGTSSWSCGLCTWWCSSCCCTWSRPGASSRP